MTEEELRKRYKAFTEGWQFMKTFLLRDSQTDPDKYWQDLVNQSYHGHDKFTAEIYVAAIREIERVKKCTSES